MHRVKTILFAAILGLGAAAVHAQVKLSLGHTLTAESHYQAFADRFKDLVEARSQGNIAVTIFGQGQLGGEVRMFQSARSGALDIVIGASAPLENTVPEFAVLSAPFLFKDLDQANHILQSEVGQHFLDYLPQRGLVGLGFVSAIERDVYTSKRPVRTLADLANLKLRVIQSPAYVDTYQALGAQPTPMAYSEVYISMQNGVIDGAENSPDTMVMDRFIEVSKFFSLTKVHYMPALVVMSKRRFDGLSADHQQLVLAAARDALPRAIEAYRTTYDDSMIKIAQAGVKIIELDTARMRDATRGAAKKLVAAIPDGTANMALLEAAIARAP